MLRRVLIIGAVVTLCAIGAYLIRPEGWSTGWHYYRVTARFIDSETKEPIPGVLVFAEPWAPANGEWLARTAEGYEDLAQGLAADPRYSEELGPEFSREDGTYEYDHGQIWCVGLYDDPPEPFWDGCGICVIVKPGYRSVEVPWRAGKQNVVRSNDPDDPDATVELGTIELPRVFGG